MHSCGVRKIKENVQKQKSQTIPIPNMRNFQIKK